MDDARRQQLWHNWKLYARRICLNSFLNRVSTHRCGVIIGAFAAWVRRGDYGWGAQVGHSLVDEAVCAIGQTCQLVGPNQAARFELLAAEVASTVGLIPLPRPGQQVKVSSAGVGGRVCPGRGAAGSDRQPPPSSGRPHHDCVLLSAAHRGIRDGNGARPSLNGAVLGAGRRALVWELRFGPVIAGSGAVESNGVHAHH